MVLCLVLLGQCVFPTDFPLMGDFPKLWPRIGMAAAVWDPTEEARKGVLRAFVANSSALLSSHSRLLLSFFSSLTCESGSHNPEVVGSNPAPATIKTTVFIENGGFSNFSSIFLRRHAVGKTKVAPPTRRRAVDGDESLIVGVIHSGTKMLKHSLCPLYGAPNVII